LLSKHSVDQIAPFGLLMPFFAMVGSVVLLGEKLSWLNIVGALLTVFGVATSQFGGRVQAWLRPHPVPGKL
jgi:O-acetylserine/cysteine efflux transporter